MCLLISIKFYQARPSKELRIDILNVQQSFKISGSSKIEDKKRTIYAVFTMQIIPQDKFSHRSIPVSKGRNNGELELLLLVTSNEWTNLGIHYQQQLMSETETNILGLPPKEHNIIYWVVLLKRIFELVSGNSLGLNTNLPIHRANRKQRSMLNDTRGMESTESRW